ncbi:hypothetical protein GCM10010191_47540 [Actinomadura vinacea]|uniref:Uncharacterized protein n=1 Tax=Actinomadura vinacea TaxID=115336 RepID=A0ABN3JFE9_9ACTN
MHQIERPALGYVGDGVPRNQLGTVPGVVQVRGGLPGDLLVDLDRYDVLLTDPLAQQARGPPRARSDVQDPLPAERCSSSRKGNTMFGADNDEVGLRGPSSDAPSSNWVRIAVPGSYTACHQRAGSLRALIL